MEEKKLGKNTKKCEGYKIKQKDLEKMILFTKEFTIPVNAPPIMIPTAKSTIFPRKANFLNSFNICLLLIHCLFP